MNGIHLALAAVLIASTAQAESFHRWESNIEEHQDQIDLWTDDGLLLTLDKSDSSARRLQIGSASFPIHAPLIRFEEVIESPDASNLLDGSLTKTWNISEDSIEDSANGHPGEWIRVAGSDSDRPRAKVTLNQTQPEPLVLSGWCQARVKGEAFGWWNRNLALNAHIRYPKDAGTMPEQSAYFGQYDHPPQFNKRIICPDRPIQDVELDLSVLGGDCVAWYRDVQLQTARYRNLIPTDPPERLDTTIQQLFTIPDGNLRGTVLFQPTSEFLKIQCLFESTEPVDRALSGYVTIPFNAVGGVWHNDVRDFRTIESGSIYRNADWYGAGRDGFSSRYPFACVENAEGLGLAIATSVHEPRVFQAEYDALEKQLRIRFDLGLSTDAGRWANRGSFTAYLFTFEDGFRGATAKYYHLFGEAFRNRVSDQGVWLAFMSPTAIAGGWEDFHFKFLESVGNMGWAAKQKMLSFRYNLAWIHPHQFPPHCPGEEAKGAVRPSAALDAAHRITSGDYAHLPFEMRQGYASYLGAWIADKWGEPQGYFFRSATGGRNENMMIVNPSVTLLPPSGTDYSFGSWNQATVQETMNTERQWAVPGWSPVRVGVRPFLEIDTEDKCEGKQSLRLTPVQGSSYYEQHLRGISQVHLYKEKDWGAFTLSFSARGEHIPETGTPLKWQVIFWYDEGSPTHHDFSLSELTEDWKSFQFQVEPRERPMAFSVRVESPTWTEDSTILWIDDVSFMVKTEPGTRELLANGGFEEAELVPCRLDGVYLDIIESYEANLNYRREHWRYAKYPLTFDWGREPAIHQIFSHAEYVRHMAEWLRPQGRLVFGNCTPKTPFVTPHLDILGNEVFWKTGEQWTPWSDSQCNYARLMAAKKPYCLLQYGDMTQEEQARYVKRCLFYGFYPSNQAAPSGGWYWAFPPVVERHRDIFAEYVPLIKQVAEAGWEPLTLASSDNKDVWIERFGSGERVYLTVFNPTETHKTAVVTLDERLGATRKTRVLNLATGKRVRWTEAGRSFRVSLDGEDVLVLTVLK